MSLLLLIGTLVYSVFCLRNFDRGLKQASESSSSQPCLVVHPERGTRQCRMSDQSPPQLTSLEATQTHVQSRDDGRRRGRDVVQSRTPSSIPSEHRLRSGSGWFAHRVMYRRSPGTIGMVSVYVWEAGSRARACDRGREGECAWFG